MHSHYSEDELQLFIDGECDAADRVEIERHLEGCTECREILGRLNDESDTLRRVLAVPAIDPDFVTRTIDAVQKPPARRTIPIWKYAAAVLSMAAAILVAVIAISPDRTTTNALPVTPAQPPKKKTIPVTAVDISVPTKSEQLARIMEDPAGFEKLMIFNGLMGGKPRTTVVRKPDLKQAFDSCLEAGGVEEVVALAASAKSRGLEFLERQMLSRGADRAKLAVTVLGRLDPARSVPLLIKAMKRPELKADARALLEKTNHDTLDCLAAALGRGDVETQKDIVGILVARNDKAAVPHLQRFVKAGVMPMEAIEKLPEVADVSVLAGLGDSRDRAEIRGLARDAIKKITGGDPKGN